MSEQASFATEQALDIVATELTKLVQNLAQDLISDHVYYKTLGHGHISGSEHLKPSNTMLAELHNDATEFLSSYRPNYAELFGISNDAFDIINEHFAFDGTNADDLMDWLDDIFVVRFLEYFSGIEYYTSNRSIKQLTQLVFKILLDNQDKVTDDDIIYDGLVLAYMRTLWQIFGKEVATVSDDDITHHIINVINIPKGILSK